MRKLLYIFLLLLCAASSYAEAPKGQYTFHSHLVYIKNTTNNARRFRLTLDATGAGKTLASENWAEVEKLKEGHTWHLSELAVRKRTLDDKPEKLYLHSYKEWSRLGKNGKAWETNIIDVEGYLNYNQEMVRTGGGIVLRADAELRLLLRPTDIQFYENDVAIGAAPNLPSRDQFVLQASSGYEDYVYDWEYRIGPSGPWTEIPRTLFTGGKTGNELKFMGTNLNLTESQIRQFVDDGTKISVRINYDTEEHHDNAEDRRIVVFTPQISAPKFVSAAVEELEREFNSGDGKVRLTFDRALEPGEVIHISIDGMISQSSPYYNITSLDAANSIVLENIVAGERKFAVSGTYNGNAMYNDSPSYERTLTVPNRPKITHSIVGSANIKCFEGSDGQIEVTAEGGNDEFVALLERINPIGSRHTQSFNKGATTLFTGLPAGEYEVTLTDSNGGRSSSTNVRITLTQPAEPLTVAIDRQKNPLAWASHDGEVTLRVGGGTKTAEGWYNPVFTHESGQSFLPASRTADGGDVLYTFRLLGRGKYSTTIQDANWLLSDKAEPCNCEAVLTFEMGAPPELLVTVDETHFINWHGGDQGEITSHAAGGVPPYTYEWFRQEDWGMAKLELPDEPVARNLTAGVYQVRITDANGVSITSANHQLTQPDPIAAQFNTVETGCAGGNTGSIEALVQGGVEPYRYQWNVEGASGNTLTGLESGTYVLKVTDARGGTLVSTIDVGSATNLEFESQVEQPTCSHLGSVRIRLKGAKPPYTVKWSDMPDSETLVADTWLVRGEMIPGNYTFEITDGNGCCDSRTFTIDDIRLISVSLPDDITMCRGQSRRIEASTEETDVQFAWFLNDEKLPETGNSIVVDKAGEYRVDIENSEGCSAEDRINIAVSADVLDLDMTVPTKIEVGTQIHAVNLSTMSADKIEWKLPEQAVVMEQSDTRLVFQLDKTGSYTISMEGFKGSGASIVTRTLEVVEKGTVELPESSPIKQFWVTPNPSTGYFKVAVELTRAEDFTLSLYMPDGTLIDKKEETGSTGKTFEYEIAGTLQGVCLLHLATKTDKSVLQIVIKR